MATRSYAAGRSEHPAKSITTEKTLKRKLLLVSNVPDNLGRMFARVHSMQSLADEHGLTVERLDVECGSESSKIGRSRILYRRLMSAEMVQAVVTSPAHFWTFTAPIVTLARFLGKPLAVHFAMTESGSFVRRIGRLGRSILRLADTVTVSAEASRTVFAVYGIRSRLLRFAPDVESMSPRNITSVQPKMLVVAPPHLPYDISPVLGALDLVKQKYPRAELLIGRVRRRDGSTGQALESIPGVTVIDLDDQKSLARLYDEADIYVSTARNDFAGWPMMRAMMAGLPVISCGSAAAEEFVHDQSDGFLLECDDYVDLADRLIELVENPDLVRRTSLNAARRWAAVDVGKIRRRWQNHFALLQNR